MSEPTGYFITIRTYGTWLHGDERGSTDAKHHTYGTAFAAANARREELMVQRMKDRPFLLAAESADLVEQTVAEVCAHRGWHLYVVKARTNHVHIVVGGAVSPERMMSDFKAWATRRLRERGFAGPAQRVWSEHGSTPRLWEEEDVFGAMDYVRNWQGGPLQKAWDAARGKRARRASGEG